MWKRIIYGGLFALVCATLITVILLQRFNAITPAEVLHAVPSDAIVYMEEVDYEYLTESFIPGSRIWIDFVNTAEKTGLDSMVQRLLGQVNSSKSLQELLIKEGFHMSIHLIGKDQLVPLVYLDYGDMYGDNEFMQVMEEALQDKAMIQERKYEAEDLYDVSGKPGFVPSTLTFACINGLCLLSPSPILVEESVRTLHSETNFGSAPGLNMVRGTAGKYVHANIYLNYKKLNQLFYSMLDPDHWNSLSALTTLASWGELDLDVKEDAVILNGMTYADREAPLLLSAFSDQSPVRIEVHEAMPSGISYFLHMGISDRDAFMEGMTDYYKGLGIWAEINSELDRLDTEYGINPLEDLVKILDNEIAWFAVEGETGSREEELLIIDTRSKSETEQIVLEWIRSYLEKHSFDMQSYRHMYRLDNQTSFPIYRLPEPFFRGLAPGTLFNQHFTLYENYLIFGPSIETLSRVIYQNVLHKTFTSDPVFKEMSDYLSNRSNISLFFRPFAFLDYKADKLRDAAGPQLESTELFLRRIPGVVIQYSNEGEFNYHSISCKYTSQIKEKALTVWESLLDSMAVIKPVLVTNHNTSEKEIFVQDAGNRIYLINSAGRVLWKQPLEGPILGEVYQVDFYKNNKLQYLFNTADRIHLIDRNGNYVERYPISLRSNATNGLALFDYDNSRDYRLFIAGEDRKIYLYNIEGNIVTGWRFGKTESTVTQPLQHFRIRSRDYILAADGNRTYILDRRGRERIKMKERLIPSKNNQFILDMNIREERPRWITTDTAGNVSCIYMDGSVSVLHAQELSSDHFFTMQDLDTDGIPEYLVADGDELVATGQDGKRMFSYRVRDRISSAPDIYKFSSSDIKIGITDQPRNRIYLINSDGSLYDGFPLEGSTRFSIGYFAGSDSRFNLIVGSTNSFLYNYSIE